MFGLGVNNFFTRYKLLQILPVLVHCIHDHLLGNHYLSTFSLLPWDHLGPPYTSSTFLFSEVPMNSGLEDY